MTESDYVVVHTAQSHTEAQLVEGLLKSEGIAALVPGSELSDEFGMAQKMSGAAEVVVLRRDLEAAKDIVAAWKAAPPAE